MNEVERLVKLWRAEAKTCTTYMVATTLNTCAGELEDALRSGKPQENTPDGWMMIRKSFYKELLVIAGEN